MKKSKLCLLIVLLVLLTSCQKVKEIHDQAYAVGMGVDYVEDEYHVVLQFLDFSNVAKSEQGKAAEKIPVWLAKGTGKTIETALIDVYDTVEMQVNYEQLNLVLFGEGIITSPEQLERAFETFTSSFTVRLTAWSYGTKEKFEDIFTSSVMFDFPFSYSRLNQPGEGMQQNATVKAIALRDFVLRINERPKTTMVPSIKLNKKNVLKSTEPVVTTVIDGAYIFSDKTYNGWLSTTDLKGYIWTNNQSQRALTEIEEEKGKHIVVELLEPSIKLKKKKNERSYDIEVDLRAMIKESVAPKVTEAQIKKRIETLVEKEVEKTYKVGQEIGADIFQLEDHLFRYHFKDWQKNKSEQQNVKLADIVINVKPLYSIDKYKKTRKDANTTRDEQTK
ncbi:Ger(x)C family spore germination protein [Metabacillus litoralis]|uniref:Ger(x)C family spore germination protein n=1 Tax=Metabacillus litoralis TaxID=152268 RepID=UPI00203AA4D1|nr:Ger(x)C family spore germination protein [Metabacillus litoralis]MCM3161611.1 Ger(x)C family spore germination protein [Metabacillus litoralis]MCM3412568.1 Ger(x)C family spore germination protein [Metabacillus litoralis]